MASLRRAIVLPIPSPAREHIDEIRRRWDPVMAARIDAHITVVHDVIDHDGARRALDAATAELAGFTVTLTTAGLWGPAGYGIYLGVEDPDGIVADLHRRLAPFETPAWIRAPYRPHVTLVHGRTVSESAAEDAWTALQDHAAGWDVAIPAIDVIELAEPAWRLVERHALARVPNR